MSSKANYFKIGLFVIGGTTIAVIGIVMLGAGALFQKKLVAETYIEESVQGLDVGSPVKFRGVSVGKVETISLTNWEYPTNRRYVLVRVGVSPEVFQVPAERVHQQGFRSEIEKGLRVRLASQGLTGAAYLEVDYLDPERNPPLEIDWQPRFLYVPSARSTVTRFSEAVDRILRSVENIDFQKVGEGIEKSLATITRAVDEARLEKLSGEAEALFAELRQTNRKFSSLLERKEIGEILAEGAAAAKAARRLAENAEEPIVQAASDLPRLTEKLKRMSEELATAFEGFPYTLAQARRTMRRLDQLISRREGDIDVTLGNIRQISENLKDLTSNAKNYPAQVLFGEPPPPSPDGTP